MQPVEIRHVDISDLAYSKRKGPSSVHCGEVAVVLQ